jgi:hypothetical protein
MPPKSNREDQTCYGNRRLQMSVVRRMANTNFYPLLIAEVINQPNALLRISRKGAARAERTLL